MHLVFKLLIMVVFWLGAKNRDVIFKNKDTERGDRLIVLDQVICFLQINHFYFKAHYEIQGKPHSTKGHYYSVNPLESCLKLEEQFDRFRNALPITPQISASDTAIKHNCLIDRIESIVRCDHIVCPLLKEDESECFHQK